MSSTINLKAVGLNFQPNNLDLPPGSLVEASDVVIRRDNVIESRRGYKLYGNSFGSTSDRAKQLFSYKDRILRHYLSTIQFDDGSGNFTSIAGSYLEAQPNLRIKTLERNGNLYITTSDGIRKLSVKNSSDLSPSTEATLAGGIRALGFSANLNVVQGDESSFLPEDSVVGYRHLFAYTDANGNLIQGVPSAKVDVYNPLQDLISIDFNSLLTKIDDMAKSTTLGTTLITDTDYAASLSVSSDPTGAELSSAIEALADKLDTDIQYTETGMTTVSASVDTPSTITMNVSTPINTYVQVGDRIKFTSFTATGLTQLNDVDFLVLSFLSPTSFTAQVAEIDTVTLTTQAITADVGGKIYSRNYFQAINNPDNSTNDATLPIPQPITDPTTDKDLRSLQVAVQRIIERLQEELNAVIADTLKAEFIDAFEITTTANVTLKITLPEGLTTSYFIQIYRSDIEQALDVSILSTLTADDEMKLVYEAFLTSADLAVGFITVTDITPSGFEGANLYTNAFTGEGILQANFPPPFALDINAFKGYVFYANTRQKFSDDLTLVGVSKLYYSGGITDIPVGGPAITISTDSTTGLSNGDEIVIIGSDSIPTVDGVRTISNVTANSFDITAGAPIISEGLTGVWYKNKNKSLSILEGSTVETYTFTLGAPEVTKITCPAGAAFSATGTADYLQINAAEDTKTYYFWFYVDGPTPPTDPMVANATGIQVVITAADSAAQVAAALTDAINISLDLQASASTTIVLAKTTASGYTTDSSSLTNTFPGTIAVDAQGQGEKVSTREILLSTLLSPARAIDETTKSIAYIINSQVGTLTYAYYEFDPRATFSGKFTLERRVMTDTPFYVVGSDDEIGSSFNPDISPEFTSVTSVAGGITRINWPSHGLTTGDMVVITNSDVPAIDGVWTITYLSANSFTIPVTTVTNATRGTASLSTNTSFGVNIAAKNRVYYSKFNQPEAVPEVNFIDIGPADKAILRIFPLRDSLFIYKQDGLYRLSGETAPFNQTLFDSSCILAAADSIGVSNNLIYGWTTQGISSTSEAGVNIISRPIDTQILKLSSNNYPNFSYVTWGTGYESDNSYIVYTIQSAKDVVAQIGYRYSNLTGSWTTYDQETTCGFVNPTDDRMYMGAGDTNFIEQERKTFTRLDFADREVTKIIAINNYAIATVDGYNIATLKQSGISDFKVGDVIVQTQTITAYLFNVLLKKLDTDPGVPTPNFYDLLHLSPGDNVRNNLFALAQKLDASGLGYNNYAALIGTYSGIISTNSIASPTVVTTTAPHNLINGRRVLISGNTGSFPSINGSFSVTVTSPTTFTIPVAVKISGTGGTFETLDQDFLDVQTCFNEIVTRLNTDTVIVFTTYKAVDYTTDQESVIVKVDAIKNQLTLSDPLEYLQGNYTLYKGITSSFQYAPVTVGDSLSWKQFSEFTLMFANKAFTTAEMDFSSDLVPNPETVMFNGDGSGAFGVSGRFGYNYFGGNSTSAPFRTYVPRSHQRCRFLNLRFQHTVAREMYAVYGASVSGNFQLSTRAYR